jgi:hypothetical protein
LFRLSNHGSVELKYLLGKPECLSIGTVRLECVYTTRVTAVLNKLPADRCLIEINFAFWLDPAFDRYIKILEPALDHVNMC